MTHEVARSFSMPQVEPEIGQLLDTNLFRGSLFRFHAKLWGRHSAEVQFLAASLKLLMGQTDQSGSTTALPYERSPQSVPSLLDLGLLLLHFRRTLQHQKAERLKYMMYIYGASCRGNPKHHLETCMGLFRASVTFLSTTLLAKMLSMADSSAFDEAASSQEPFS